MNLGDALEENSQLRAQVAELEQREQAGPVAWAIFSDNGNIRIWSANTPNLGAIAERIGPLIPLFSRTLADHIADTSKMVKADEIEALRRDAERYRWLREEAQSRWEGERGPVLVHATPWTHTQWREELDGAIDAAMAQHGEQSNG